MAFKGGVVIGTVNLNATGSGNTSLGATSNSGTVAIGNASSTAINVLGPTNVNVTGAANTAIGSTSNTGTVAIGNTNSTSVTVVGPVNINTSSTNNTAINSTSNSGTVSIGNGSSGLIAIDCGTAGINVGTTANAHTTTVGSTTAASTTTIQAPSAGVILTGVQGVAVANKNYVTINTSTGAIGSDAGPSGNITITGDSGGGLTGNSFTFTGGTTGLTFAGAGSTETLGGTLAIANGGTDATSFSTSTGIVKYDGTRLVTSSTAMIDSSNRQTNSSQPAFSAYKGTSSTNATGDGTVNVLSFDTTSFDQGSNFDTTNHYFVAPVAGIYFFTVSAFLSNIPAAASAIQLTFLKNGSASSNAFYIVQTASSVGGFIYDGSAMLQLAANDHIGAQIYVAGTTKTVTINSGPSSTFLCGYLVC